MDQFKIDDHVALDAVIKKWFEPEHGLIDAWVFDTTTEDWQKTLDFISSRFQQLRYYVEGEPSKLPALASEVLEVRPKRGNSLSINIDGIALHSYFFCREEIDFDINPREVRHAPALQHVFEFFGNLANRLGKDIVITTEGNREFAIFRLRPDSEVVDYRQSPEE